MQNLCNPEERKISYSLNERKHAFPLRSGKASFICSFKFNARKTPLVPQPSCKQSQ